MSRLPSFVRRFASRPIAVRLAVSSVFWSFVILLIAGLILSTLYRDNTERAFDQRLLVYANTLASNLVGPGDPDRDLGPIGDPRFELPLSGWYWQVARPNAALAEIRSSKSLFGGQLPSLASGDNRFGQIRRGYGKAPDDRNLRIIERDIDLGEDGRYIIRVAGPADEIDVAVRDFIFALTVTFALLGIGLGFTTLLQIRFGLRPLANLRSALGAIRRGEAERIAGEYPRDISPLASELNLLLDTNREILERARTQVGNLAHALKTPLSIIMNEAENAPEDVAAKVREQATTMRDQVNYYLDRARAAALAGTLGTLTEAEPVIAGLARTFAKIYRDKELEVELVIPSDLRFRGEKQDLEEMAGNLIDNAAKWAAYKVMVSVEILRDDDRPRFRLLIDDDGPGLPEAAREEVLKRGRRLDETKPGSGLGLSIVSDLAALYRGTLRLDASPAGGLRAILELPGDRSST
ncbi:ATP-binding protein [Microvirga lotononidis]|uniref:histidine kinase n=1 Tax=Microvirga lotononidis TaxID=864069 RepID=I4YNC4_9HYPH|nr:ATP-binding protein [Microvirga lotononidis]EIM25466.1 signal transduction histidine kinase [Microvirga lotononidis]WQO26223.1 ATP-binding protein [Microvirga lotononidis]